MLLIGSGNVVHKLQLSMPKLMVGSTSATSRAYLPTSKLGAATGSVGLARPTEAITHTFGDVTFRSISMRTFQVG